MDTTPKTIGSLAERNADRGGRYWVESKRQQIADDKKKAREAARSQLPPGMVSAMPDKIEKPWYRETEKPNMALNNLTPSQKHNYVMTGNPNG